MSKRHLTLPLTDPVIDTLHAGDAVLLTGTLLVARDAAHARLAAALAAGEPLPVSVVGETVYYMGPSPAREGRVIGSAGPTTSTRMDKYTPGLLQRGLKAMIGKGRRSPAVIEAMKTHHAVYFAAVGGCGALLSRCVTAAETVCYPDLDPEAVRRITVRDLPCIVAIDCRGENLYR